MLTRLAETAHRDPSAARRELLDLDDEAPTQAVILAALGSRDPAAAAALLMEFVDGYPTAALALLETMVTLRGRGPRQLLRHLATNSHGQLAAVLMLAESGSPTARDTILRLLG